MHVTAFLTVGFQWWWAMIYHDSTTPGRMSRVSDWVLGLGAWNFGPLWNFRLGIVSFCTLRMWMLLRCEILCWELVRWRWGDGADEMHMGMAEGIYIMQFLTVRSDILRT